VTPQRAEIKVSTSPDAGIVPSRCTMHPRSDLMLVLNFCANNYLGLSDNAELIVAAKKYLDSHGLGLSSVRFICGTQDIHKESF
jgi:7-keto-8-aminopelargonate synthetase-like enzyme